MAIKCPAKNGHKRHKILPRHGPPSLREDPNLKASQIVVASSSKLLKIKVLNLFLGLIGLSTICLELYDFFMISNNIKTTTTSKSSRQLKLLNI